MPHEADGVDLIVVAPGRKSQRLCAEAGEPPAPAGTWSPSSTMRPRIDCARTPFAPPEAGGRWKSQSMRDGARARDNVRQLWADAEHPRLEVAEPCAGTLLSRWPRGLCGAVSTSDQKATMLRMW